MKKLAVGIMSGTSLDGIDIVIAKIEGHFLDTSVDVVAFETISYSEIIKDKIIQSMDFRQCNPKLICSLNYELSYAYYEAIKEVCSNNNISLMDIDFIACHGQTIYHINEDSDSEVKSSLQLGDGSVLANISHKTVVSNFRSADIAVGGVGAPLVPYADYILFLDQEISRSLHNIGGISNLTYLQVGSSLEEVIAFDTGPGNMIIDYFAKKFFSLPYDASGDIARKGRLNQRLISFLMSHSYLKQLPPKSTGRELFGDTFALEVLKQFQDLPQEDILCTITHFTAKSIAKAYEDFILKNHPLDEIVFSGGGARNDFLLELVHHYLPSIHIKKSSEFGIDESAKEALAFLILGNETLNMQSSNVKAATGANQFVILGQISYVLQ